MCWHVLPCGWCVTASSVGSRLGCGVQDSVESYLRELARLLERRDSAGNTDSRSCVYVSRHAHPLRACSWANG